MIQGNCLGSWGFIGFREMDWGHQCNRFRGCQVDGCLRGAPKRSFSKKKKTRPAEREAQVQFIEQFITFQQKYCSTGVQYRQWVQQ